MTQCTMLLRVVAGGQRDGSREKKGRIHEEDSESKERQKRSVGHELGRGQTGIGGGGGGAGGWVGGGRGGGGVAL